MGQEEGLDPAVDSALRELAGAAGAAVEQLQDEDSTDLEELGGLVAGLHARAQALMTELPAGSTREALWAVCRHLHEARDLLDDGEPPDAAAFEVLSARDRLRALLS